MTPTSEQLAIIAAAQSTSDNLIIEADAGAAKTSTLVMIAEALPDVNILCLAFNKKIAVEMDERMPPNVKAMTLNALGHKVWMDATGRRIRIDGSKTFEIVQYLVKSSPRAVQDVLWKNFGELIRHVDFGKACGYIPSGHFETARRLMGDDDFFAHLDQNLLPEEEDLIRDATICSIKAALTGYCDFNDQILMPTLFHGAFPLYNLTLVDEAQDLSALNHATLRKMCKRRVIAVGDPAQAIYGFRGAHEDSMQVLQQEFAMRSLTLTTSFRCPQAIIKHVHWRKPQMRWPEWAKVGEVKTLSRWSAADLEEDATIICRNNAPLFGTAIRLLKNGRTCQLDGKDIVTAILKVMRKFGGHEVKQHSVLEKIDAWCEVEKEKNKARAHNRIEDRAECMRIFAKQGNTLGDAIAYAEELINLHAPLKLMTGHKAKGLEFNYVYFLDQKLVGKEEQDPNLRYVICTRAKETLTYIRSEDFVDAQQEKVCEQA